MALAEQAELVVKLSLRDGLSSGIKTAQSRLTGLQRDFRRTGDSLGKFRNNLRLFGVGVAATAALAINEFAKFEDQLATINTVANVTDEQLLAIGESLKALAIETGTALPELTAAYYDLVSAGVSAADAQHVLTNATKLAIGGLATTGETVDLLTTAINSYGLKASEVTTVTNGFAQTIALGKITAAELAQSFATVAPIASAAGVSIKELQAGYAQLTASGVPAAEASTQMRAAIQALIKPSGGLQKLQAKLGINFAQIAKNKGLVVAYERLRKETDALGINTVELLGRVEATSFMFSTTGRNAEKYQTALQQIKRANDDGGVSVQQFEKRQRTLSASFARLREAGRTTALIFGGALAPALKRVVDRIVTLVVDNKADIEKLGTKFGEFLDEIGSAENLQAGFDALQRGFDFIGNIDWGTIRGAFDTTAAIAKQAFDIFNGLPQPVKDSLVALLAVNRVTGGLATALIRDVGGIFLRSLTTVNAAVVNVFGTSVNTGVPGVPGAAPAAAAPAAASAVRAVVPFIAAVAGAAAINTVFQGDMTKGNLATRVLVKGAGGEPSSMDIGVGTGMTAYELLQNFNNMIRIAVEGARGGAGIINGQVVSSGTRTGFMTGATPEVTFIGKLNALAAQGEKGNALAQELYTKYSDGVLLAKDGNKLLKDVKVGTAATEKELAKVRHAIAVQEMRVTLQPLINISATATGNSINFAAGGSRLIIPV
jgi:TP901 family phage tail tape measure protein